MVANVEPLEPGLLDGLFQVLGQQLSLLVEVVARADVDEHVEGALVSVVQAHLLSALTATVVFGPREKRRKLTP